MASCRIPLGIPDSILLKPGPLTADERTLLQRHAQIGCDLVKDIAFLSDASEIVLTHHERYNGAGYLRGLRGDEILPAVRIFAVADSFDAITSDRPYRRAASFAEGRETIRRCPGALFDPRVVSSFLSIPEETWPAIAQEGVAWLTNAPARLARSLVGGRILKHVAGWCLPPKCSIKSCCHGISRCHDVPPAIPPEAQ